jgi:hypothetical protein
MKRKHMKRKLFVLLLGALVSGCALVVPDKALPLFEEEIGQNKEIKSLDKTNIVVLKVEKNHEDTMFVALEPRVSSTTCFGADYVFSFSTVNECDVRVRYYPYSTSVGLSLREIEKREPSEEVMLRLGEHWFTQAGWKVTSMLKPNSVLPFVTAVLKNRALPYDFYLRKDKDWNLTINDLSGKLVAKCSNSMGIEYKLPKKSEVIKTFDGKLLNQFESFFSGNDASFFFTEEAVTAMFHYKSDGLSYEATYTEHQR